MTTNTSYTLMAFGTGESYHMPKKNFLTQFFDYCTAAAADKSYLDGPSLLGLEVKANAESGHARIIAWLESKTAEEDLAVNLTGFSRGAVTCIHIANRLNRHKEELESIPESDRTPDQKQLLAKLAKLQLNLFLVDPVAGYMAKSTPDARIIPKNVTNAAVFYQLHEGRRDFKPQDMTRMIVEDPNKTRLTMLPLYGHHSASIKDKGNGMDSAAQIVWSTLHSFFINNGSEYEVVPAMVNTNNKDEVGVSVKSNEALCDSFASHHAQRENYAAASKEIILTDSLPIARVPRKINQHLEFYVRDSDFFVNKLERELFKITYPTAFNYLFEGNKKDPRFPHASGSKIEDVQAEIDRMKKASPMLHGYLKIKGKIDEQGKLIASTAVKSSALESLSAVEILYPDRFKALGLNEGEKEKYNKEWNELEALTQSIYRLTFQYQREKSPTDIFKKRTEDARAERIRREVLAIAKEGGDPKETKDKILNLIYEDALALRLVGSKSQLLAFLDKTLEENGCECTVALENEDTLQLIRAGFKLVDEAIYFVSTGGYVIGGGASAVGRFCEDIGDRLMGLAGNSTKETGNDAPNGVSTDVSENTSKDVSNETPQALSPKQNLFPKERVLSKIGEAFLAIGKAFNDHFGLKSRRENLRAEIAEARDSFFLKKLVSADRLAAARNPSPKDGLLKAAEKTSPKDRQLCSINKALKELGPVDGNSPENDINRYNQLQYEKALLEQKDLYECVSKKTPGTLLAPTYWRQLPVESSPARSAAPAA